MFGDSEYLRINRGDLWDEVEDKYEKINYLQTKSDQIRTESNDLIEDAKKKIEKLERLQTKSDQIRTESDDLVEKLEYTESHLDLLRSKPGVMIERIEMQYVSKLEDPSGVPAEPQGYYYCEQYIDGDFDELVTYTNLMPFDDEE